MNIENDDKILAKSVSIENLSEEDKLFLRDLIESTINETLLKAGMIGEF